MKRTKQIASIGALVFFAVLVVIGLMRIHTINQIKTVGNQFIISLSSGNIKQALKYADGEIAFKLSNTQNMARAQVVKNQIMILHSNKAWARVAVQTDLLLADDSYDVGWYEMDMYSNGGDWKVLSLRQCSPMIYRQGAYSNTDEFKIKRVFTNYFSLLKQGDFATAVKYLAGPARRAQEQMVVNYLIEAKLQDLNIKPLYGNKEIIVAETSYILQGSEVSNIVTFYKTSDGWKIADIVSN